MRLNYGRMHLMKQIAIQGGEASFHDIAARLYFKEQVSIISCELPFKNVFTALGNSAEYAVCAIENSLYGSINEVYDLLLSFGFPIVGEVYLPIRQQLIGFPGIKPDEVLEVHSHPVAFAQCEDFLDSTLAHATRHEHSDTALSVRDVKESGNKKRTAIASKEAAELYDMAILKENIETNHENYTRFVVLGKQTASISEDNKTSLVLQTREDTKPGALYEALGVFAERDLNLTLLHSRPVVGKAWHYMFYIDVIGGAHDGSLEGALQELSALGYMVTSLGTYSPGKIQ
jgi:prephenate dehydratase